MRVSLRRFVLSFFCLATLPLFAQSTINIPADYPTIQQGIDAASSGDTVQVSNSKTWFEHLIITGKGITLRGGNKTLGYVTLDGGGAGPAISILGSAASNTHVNGFLIQNAGKPPTPVGVHGAVYVSNASPTLQDLQLRNNFCAGLYATYSNAIFEESLVSGTLATGCPTEEGAGSAVVYTNSDPNSSVAFILNNILTANVSSKLYTPDKGGGGAINITNHTIINIENNLITDNVSAGYGGAVYIASTPNVNFINNLVYGNKGLSGGLDIVIPGSSVGPLQGQLTNNTIAFNTATSSNAGSDIYIGGNLAQYQFNNNIVVGSTNGQFSVNCGNLYAGQTITPLVLDHNDFYSLPSSTNKPVGGACTNPAGTHGNISADPLFVDASASSLSSGQANLQVQAGSPVIDTGNNSVASSLSILNVANDYRGYERFIDATNKGYANIDIGAYEYNSQPGDLQPHPANLTQLSLGTDNWSPNAGSTINLTAGLTYDTTSGTATGTYTFYEDDQPIATSATGHTSVPNLTVGSHQFYVTYTGDPKYTSSTSVYIYILVSASTTKATQTTLTSSLNPSNVGDSVTFTVSVQASGATPTGNVTLTDGNVVLQTLHLDSSGNAIYTTSTLTAGDHPITAGYAATGNFGASSSLTLIQHVNVIQTTATATSLGSSKNPSTVGDSIILTATVIGLTSSNTSPTGSINFTDNGTLLMNVLVDGTGHASYPISTLAAGTHSLTASFMPTGNFASSFGNLSQVVNAVPLTASKATLNITPNTIAYGATTTLTATVTAASGPNTPIPSGPVTFFEGSTQIGAASLNGAGIASLPINTLSAGTHTITCVYGGNIVYATSACAGVTLTVNQANAALTLVSNANPSPALMAVNFTATFTNTSLAGNPPIAGVALRFAVDGVAQATTPITDVNGKATLTLELSAGQHQIAVTNGVTTNYTTATMALTETEQPNPTSLLMGLSANPAYFGQTVNAIVVISTSTGTASAGGTITVFDSGKAIATGLVTSMLCLPAMGAGTGAAACFVQPSTLTFPLTGLSVGDHPLTATFTPDINFLASSTSAATTLTVKPSGFTLTADPAALSVQTQHHTALTLTVASIGNFSGGVSLACSTMLPPVLKCGFSQINLQLAVNGTASTKLTLETDAIDNFYPASFGRNTLLTLLTLLPLSLLALRKRRGFAALAVLALATLALTTGCSGHYPNHTPPGTYDIAITATAAGNIAQPQTAHITLTVTP